MSISVVVPNLGESVVEGTVARWLVAEGESVTMDQIIVELTTDKVDVEIPSPSAGVIEKIVAGVDDTVEVGAELAVIDENGTAQATSQPIVSSPPPAPPEAAPALAPIPAPGPTAPAPTPLAQRAADQAGVDTSQLQGSGGHGRVTQRDVVAQQPA
ncbi:MAG: pyruvate dehydrogenase E2 component (dihydrolipoamide acetyltransferase), partial [Myxococcota bacterium]